MLSSLLGSAKPPVASAQDVAVAEGIFQINQSTQDFRAVSASGNCEFSLAQGERCLICLEQYRTKEFIRQLVKCSHVFHQKCIDEVRETPQINRCIS